MPFLITAILILGLYFGADLLIKVRALNDLTPSFPVAGTVLALAVIWFVWVVFLGPVISFYRLATGATSTHSRAKAAIRELKQYSACADDPDSRKRELFALWQALYNAKLREPEKLPELLAEYTKKSELHLQAIQYIHSSCKAAAIGVVISRNKFLDGLVLLIMQMKMIVSLARMFGYKPSLVFNSLCFGWAVANSMMFALMSSSALEAAQNTLNDQVIDPALDNLSEHIFEPLMDYAGELIGMEVGAAAGTSIPFIGGMLSAGSRIVMEAILGALPVYVTGRVFLMRLENDARAIDMKTLVNIRREGRSAMWEIWKKQENK